MSIQVLRTTGDADVARIHVAQVRQNKDLLIECVDGLDPPKAREDKWIVNISTQIGCPVGCPFCDAGGGFRGNLDVEELLGQVDWVLAQHPDMAARCQKLKVHFARMGEPALNDAVLSALQQLPHRHNMPGLWACLATVAPSHRQDWFDHLLEIKQQLYRGRFQLQFSVNSTDPVQREQFIPMPHWSLQQIAQYGARFFQRGDRKLLLNFALAKDSQFDPLTVKRIFNPDIFAIKLTPLNPTFRGQQNGFITILRSQRSEQVDRSIQELKEAGFDVVLSIGDVREDEVGSNCGQAVRWFQAQENTEAPHRSASRAD